MKQTQPLFPNSYGDIPYQPTFPLNNNGPTPPSSLGHSAGNNGSNYARNLTPPSSLERDKGGLRNSGSFSVPVRGPTPPFPDNFHQRKPGPVPVSPTPGQRGPGGSLFEDLGSGDFFSNPVAQIGLSYGHKWAEDASEKYKQGITKYLESTNLKYYFNINNSYVPNKLKILLCPFLHKSMKRLTAKMQDGAEVYLPPKDDINAPDLYIPVMAFVTYVITIAFVLGTRNSFTPEVLGRVASSGLVALVFEVLFLKLGFYLLNSVTVTILDLVAYCGYIFVGLVINQFVGVLGGSYIYYATTLVTGVFMAMFMVKTLRLLVLSDPNPVANAALPYNKRNYFLLSVAVWQLLMAYFLGFW